MRHLAVFGSTLGALLLAGQAFAADDGGRRVFEPQGDWTAQFETDYCRLSRNFSDGTNTVTLSFERIQPGNAARTIIIGNGISLYRRATTIGYHFLPDGSERQAFLLRSETSEGNQYLNMGYLAFSSALAFPAPGAPPPPYSRSDEASFARSVNGIMLTDGTVQPVEIRTGALRNVAVALQICADDLVKFWGLDVEKHQSMKQAPYPDGETDKWVPIGTIPFQDFAKLGGGDNLLRLMIDANGKPTDCHVHFPSLDEGKNQAVCKALLENAKFHPALDAEGNAMASYYVVALPLLNTSGPFGRRR